LNDFIRGTGVSVDKVFQFQLHSLGDKIINACQSKTEQVVTADAETETDHDTALCKYYAISIKQSGNLLR